MVIDRPEPMFADPAMLPRWVAEGQFVALFRAGLDTLHANYAIDVRLDEPAMLQALARWQGIRASRGRLDSADRREPAACMHDVVDDFGRLVRELVSQPGLLHVDLPHSAEAAVMAAAAWPSGFCIYAVVMMLCRTALGAQSPMGSDLSGRALDARTWWSIKENIAEDAQSARPFLAYLLGIETTWHDYYRELSA